MRCGAVSSSYFERNGLAVIGLWFVLLAVAVGLIGIALARSADRVGEAFRLDRSITGFMLLAAATSLPELFVSTHAARNGAADMAVGSLLGSCLMILAVIDMSRPSRRRMLSRKAAAHVISALASIALAAIVGLAVMSPDWPALGRVHLGSFLVLAVYLLTVRLVFVDRAKSRVAEALESEQSSVVLEGEPIAKTRPLAIYALATVSIFVLASPLAVTSDGLALALGLSGTFFGAVFLALVTSLPEIMTTYEASRIDAEDMAIGNILGSNAFNLVLLIAVDVAYPEPLFASLGPVHAVAAMGVVLVTVIASMGMLYRVEKRTWFSEPDAAAVIGVALIFFYLLYRG